MAIYLLVPGAWLGGWAFAPVARRLRRHDHDVYPLTLTGLGDRAHLARPEVDLDTHVTDVVATILCEDLREVVLVGHSYAGIVVTGAADRVRDRIAQVVYLDSGPVSDGSSYLDLLPPAAREANERQAAERGDGWRLPMPSWKEIEDGGASLEGLDDAERALMRSRATDQPFRTYTQPLRLTGQAGDPLPKVLIATSYPLDQVRQLIAGGHPWFAEMAGPEWRLRELPTGHWAMVSRPDDLADLLHDVGTAPGPADRGPEGRQLPA